MLLKLYKTIDNQLHYWETWDLSRFKGIIHKGIVGDKGVQTEIKAGFLSSYKSKVKPYIDKQIANGFKEFDDEELIFLDIEYEIDGFGTDKDLEKRHRLEERINETLGWTGLGHVDGGSIGSGTMELGCIVVDFDIAKRVIEADLKDTQFGDYSRIINTNT